MADESKPRPPVETFPTLAGGVSALGSANAPFLFFDRAASFGFSGGIGRVTLEAGRLHSGANEVLYDWTVVAHLRMGIDAVVSLRDALNGVILLAKPKPEGPAN
jgi:hypothetical protein